MRLSLFALVAAAVYAVYGVAPGEWRDDFDSGTLDESAWTDWVSSFQGRSSGFLFARDNVSVSNGCLNLTARLMRDDEKTVENLRRGFDTYATAYVRSKKKFHYGYFECRAKTMNSKVCNAFWLYDPLSDKPEKKFRTGDYSEEIDMFEIFGSLRDWYGTVHCLKTPYLEGIVYGGVEKLENRSKKVRLEFDPSADFHVYGFRWTEKELVWYIDGKEVFRRVNDRFHRPLHVTFDCEIMYSWVGEPRKDSLPQVFSIDWFSYRPLEKAPPRPRPAMAERILSGDCEVYGIVHWGLNTYTDREWGYGDENPEALAPRAFDADKIVSACKAGGLAGLVVVAKHHDGFCLWPTKTTSHNITKAKGFRGGKGDYVKEMADACRRHGIKFGVYVSPWDRNSAHYGRPEYVEMFHAQIKELLNGDYGEVFEMWFDGANGGDGWYGGARERRNIGCADEYYRFDTVFGFVRGLQPKVCIFAGENDSSDLRWPGNEKGELDPDSCATVCTVGSFVNGRYGNPEYRKHINTGMKNSEGASRFPMFFRVCECDFPMRPGWFYHAKDKGRTKSAIYLLRRYLNGVGNGGTMNIGVSPNKDGVLDAEDVKVLSDFGKLRKAFFAKPVEKGLCNVVVMTEDVVKFGESCEKWTLVDTSTGGELLTGKTIGIKRIRTLDRPIAAESLELKVVTEDSANKPSMKFYYVEPDFLRAVLTATTDSGETDTAKWMNKGR